MTDTTRPPGSVAECPCTTDPTAPSPSMTAQRGEERGVMQAPAMRPDAGVLGGDTHSRSAITGWEETYIDELGREWGDVLCEWGEELAVVTARTDDVNDPSVLDHDGLMRTTLCQLWLEGHAHRMAGVRSEVEDRFKPEIARLDAEIEKLRAAADREQLGVSV